MEAISESDSFTAWSERLVADLVESRSEKFQENLKKKYEVLKGAFISAQVLVFVFLVWIRHSFHFMCE